MVCDVWIGAWARDLYRFGLTKALITWPLLGYLYTCCILNHFTRYKYTAAIYFFYSYHTLNNI